MPISTVDAAAWQKVIEALHLHNIQTVETIGKIASLHPLKTIVNEDDVQEAVTKMLAERRG